jgi:hypothetical protein
MGLVPELVESASVLSKDQLSALCDRARNLSSNLCDLDLSPLDILRLRLRHDACQYCDYRIGKYTFRSVVAVHTKDLRAVYKKDGREERSDLEDAQYSQHSI